MIGTRRIFGGGEQEPHHWPSTVRMRTTVKNSLYCGLKHCGSCGASILNNEWMITAGHCCTLSYSRIPLLPSAVSFSIGAHYDETCGYSHRCNEYSGSYRHIRGTVVKAKKIVVHPDYHVRLSWDFCLVQVEPMNLDGRTVDRVYIPG